MACSRRCPRCSHHSAREDAIDDGDCCDLGAGAGAGACRGYSTVSRHAKCHDLVVDRALLLRVATTGFGAPRVGGGGCKPRTG